MNILHIRPEIEIGGASEYLIRLITGLGEKGHRSVVVSGGGAWGPRLQQIARHYNDLPLSPSRAHILLASAVITARIIRREEIDLINTHHRFAALVGKLASILTRKPLISTVHEVKANRPRLTGLGLGHNVITLSEMVKQYLVTACHIRQERIAVIPMGVEIDRLASQTNHNALIKAVPFDISKPIIGCIGRLEEEKGQIFLIRAIPEVLAKHPQAQFVFVGDGNDRTKLEQLAKELYVADNVFFLGYRDDVADLIGAFRFTVLPSLREGFGIAAVESFAQKKPVVATSVGGIPEMIKPQENGLLVPAQDSVALSKAILYLLDNPDHVSRMGLNGYQMVAEHYSLTQFIDRSERLYRSVLS